MSKPNAAHFGRAIRPCVVCTAPTTRRWCSRACAETWRRYADEGRGR